MEQTELVSASDLPALFLQYHATLVRYASSRLWDDGEDVAQQTWVRAWRALQDGAIVPLPVVQRWLFRIATHLIIDTARHRNRALLVPLEDHEDAALDDHLESRVAEMIARQRAFACLSPAERQILWLDGQGFSEKEMALALGIRVTAVKMRLSRARAQARRYYEQEAS